MVASADDAANMVRRSATVDVRFLIDKLLDQIGRRDDDSSSGTNLE